MKYWMQRLSRFSVVLGMLAFGDPASCDPELVIIGRTSDPPSCMPGPNGTWVCP